MRTTTSTATTNTTTTNNNTSYKTPCAPRDPPPSCGRIEPPPLATAYRPYAS